ncbi:MAG: YIEGIA family protein [Dethiobacteria bacterium]
MEDYLTATLLGSAWGLLTRYLMLKSDYRQFPGYPHGYVTHLSLGLVATLLGSLAIPAIFEKEFTAVTFLSLAATQFRDVREMERKTLSSLDMTKLVPRGPDYIEGISRVFEARNYLSMLMALIVSGTAYIFSLQAAIPVGLAVLLLAIRLMRGEVIQDIATVRPGEIRFKGPNLYVDDIHVMNLGSEGARQKVMERGLGVVIEPKDDDARSMLANAGQRMAIAHDAALQLGIYKDVDTPEFMPILRRDLDTGRVVMVIVPIEMDMECLLLAVSRVPVLESAYSRPLQSRAGAGAAD